jgi:hypothetical protein
MVKQYNFYMLDRVLVRVPKILTTSFPEILATCR